MAAEPTTRFAHLLQPIRDLSKVWKIEIAEELEKYIDEIAQLLVTNPEDGITQLNFAEAALLIQGSTAIYSRKVELLYQLVYQALDLLALDKKEGGKRGKVVQTGLWAPIPETDELVTIDHLIKEGRNLLLDHTAPQQRQAEQRRVPLFLMPRDQTDRRKTEFRISSCTVHPSGVYLLQASDSKLVDGTVGDVASGEAPLVPAPPAEVLDLDSRLQELLHGTPAEGDVAQADAIVPSPADEAQAQTPAKTAQKGEMDMTPAKTPHTAMRDANGLALAGVLSAADPWGLLNEHEQVGQDLPLEVGNTSKKVNAKKLLATADGLPDASNFEGMSDAELWSEPSPSANIAPMLAAGNPIESLFLAVAGHLKSGGRYESQRAGFSAAWLEFEDLFSAAQAKRRQGKAHARKGPQPIITPHASDDEGEGNQAMMDTPGGGALAATPARDGGIGMTPLPDLTAEEERQQEQRKEVAKLEEMIEEAQVKYEATIRKHLHSMQKDGVEADGGKGFSQLYTNVKRWQDQLEPVLKEFESRPPFNIHEYGTKFLDKMKNIQKDGPEEGKEIPFSRLVYGQPRWEVCRRFLTCLILTNHGNTDIVFDNEEQRLNGFRIKLLKADKKMISLEEEAKDSAKAAVATRGKKVSAAVADGAPAAKKQRKA